MTSPRHLLREKYARIARWYDVLDLFLEHQRYGRLRRHVFDRVRDCRRILDCGMGTGRNIDWYPLNARVVGFDLSLDMIIRARRHPAKSDVSMIEADAVQLPFAANSFDAAASTFLFCVLPDELQSDALSEIRRVLQPGSRVVLLDYVLSAGVIRRRWMHLWAPWVRFAYGASFTHSTAEHVQHVGMKIEERQFLYSDIIEMIVARV